ncbi:uncharacterized protein LOC143899680 isoform X10 [Temnothorax americanus]|uniref:uncharacterized protein LOC143899680 isoform X10 n=1 Tax=Temnothorax americanus TaxID=1964332 RepID=UPI0040689670
MKITTRKMTSKQRVNSAYLTPEQPERRRRPRIGIGHRRTNTSENIPAGRSISFALREHEGHPEQPERRWRPRRGIRRRRNNMR